MLRWFENINTVESLVHEHNYFWILQNEQSEENNEINDIFPDIVVPASMVNRAFRCAHAICLILLLLR